VLLLILRFFVHQQNFQLRRRKAELEARKRNALQNKEAAPAAGAGRGAGRGGGRGAGRGGGAGIGGDIAAAVARGAMTPDGLRRNASNNASAAAGGSGGGGSGQRRPRAVTSPSSMAPPDAIDQALVLEDYIADDDTELSLIANEKLWVFKKADDWHLGCAATRPAEPTLSSCSASARFRRRRRARPPSRR
jgi:hypothetical protein